jgi:hypothetical protein
MNENQNKLFVLLNARFGRACAGCDTHSWQFHNDVMDTVRYNIAHLEKNEPINQQYGIAKMAIELLDIFVDEFKTAQVYTGISLTEATEVARKVIDIYDRYKS